MIKRVKKGISLICLFTMCFMCIYNNGVQARENVAIDTKDNIKLDANEINLRLTKDSVDVKDKNIGKINSDMKILNRVGVLTESKKQIDKITINSDDNVSYLVKIGKDENLVSIESDFTDRIELFFQQGDISNTVAIYDDGKIYLDGKLIEAKNSTDGTVVANNVEEWADTPLYGSSSDYQYYHSTDSCSNVPLQNTLQNIAVGTFVSVVVYVMGPIYYAIGASVIVPAYYYLKATNPIANAISYRAYIYTIANGTGYINSTYGWCYEYNFDFYAEKDYKYYAYSRTQYRQIFPY